MPIDIAQLLSMKNSFGLWQTVSGKAVDWGTGKESFDLETNFSALIPRPYLFVSAFFHGRNFGEQKVALRFTFCLTTMTTCPPLL
jgi:hypothetical protein